MATVPGTACARTGNLIVESREPPSFERTHGFFILVDGLLPCSPRLADAAMLARMIRCRLRL
jgi:hypothetical protein